MAHGVARRAESRRWAGEEEHPRRPAISDKRTSLAALLWCWSVSEPVSAPVVQGEWAGTQKSDLWVARKRNCRPDGCTARGNPAVGSLSRDLVLTGGANEWLRRRDVSDSWCYTLYRRRVISSLFYLRKIVKSVILFFFFSSKTMWLAFQNHSVYYPPHPPPPF